MKVAVEISGMQRYGAFFPDLLRTLNGVFGTVDLFVHHWQGPYSEADIRAKTGFNPVRAIRIDPAPAADDLLINPAWQTNPAQTPIYNVVSMCASILSAAMLRSEYGGQYDLVVRARSDIRVHGFPQDPAWARRVPPGTIRVGQRPGYLRDYPLGIQDQFAIGRAEDMARYAMLSNNLPEFHREEPGRHYHPETYVGWSVRHSGLLVDESAFTVELERAYLHPKDRSTY